MKQILADTVVSHMCSCNTLTVTKK